MKKDTHPEYHLIDVKLINGDVIQMKSTWGDEGKQMALEVDPSRAWGSDQSGSSKNAALLGRHFSGKVETGPYVAAVIAVLSFAKKFHAVS